MSSLSQPMPTEPTSRDEISRFPETDPDIAVFGWEDVPVSSKNLVLVGWLLFTVSGVFFLIDALESGDKTALGSALTWIVGVLFFIAAGWAGSEEPNV